MRPEIILLLLLVGVCRSEGSSFRSHHPHYLHSRSYPTPSTLHMYYGRVEGNTPVFLIQKGNDGQESAFFVLENKVDPAQSKLKSLRSYVEDTDYFRSILVFAIEDSYESGYREQARLQRATGNYCYALVLANHTGSKAYVVRASRDNEVQQLEHIQKELAFTWRNVSANPKNNWRLSRQINWYEIEPGEWVPRNYNVTDYTNFTAMAVQLRVNSSLLGTLKVHIDEVMLEPSLAEDAPNEILQHLLTEYDHAANLSVQRHQQRTCQSDAVSKLLKGLSFEYGRLHLAHNKTPIENAPRELLSFSPSRKRFPWGFLWDDGFHNEVIVRSEPDISLKVIKSWLDTMLAGWIPREQDRGIEREELCNCDRFLVKDDRDGNPPSLVLALGYLLKTRKLTLELLGQQSWNKLKEWHAWYMKTQMVGENTYLFKWFDHIESEGSFNSGLDDFPRPQGSLYHVDAQCWMYQLTRFMYEASVQFLDPHSSIYENQMNQMLSNLHQFKDVYTNIFKDVGSPSMVRGGLLNPYSTPGFPSVAHPALAQVNYTQLPKTYSEHIGYPSLLPLAFGMITKNTPEYTATINLISQPNSLNTGHGLSSISQSSFHYLASKDSYWRGPVWINMNYLVLRGLKLYYPEQDKLYQQLRTQLIDTVCGEWNRTGYFFENYIRGVGSFSFPFNGWTSLIALIITEDY